MWDRLAGELEAMGILHGADAEHLAALASSVAMFAEAERTLAKEGYMYEDSNGQRRRNPWILVRRDAVNEIVRLGSAFGLTPVARAHLAKPAKPDEPTAGLLSA